MKTIKIPTNFETKDEMIEMLSKKIGRSKLFYNYQSRLWTEIRADDTLVLTSDGKRLGAFEFVGEICRGENSIYLKGYVQKRKDIEIRQKIYCLMMIIIAIFMMMTLNIVFIFMGILFIIVSLMNAILFKTEAPFIKFIENNIQV